MSYRAQRIGSSGLLTAAALAATLCLGTLPLRAQVPTLTLPGGTAPATPGATAGSAITLVPGTVPATMPTPPATMPTTPATMPTAAEVAPVTQPFTGIVTGDKVYIRSGPDQKNYEIGQLVKGDLVYVMGLSKGFYQILPPNGSFCLVDKQFVAVDATGKLGTLTGDYVNVHAGSATFRGDPYAILPPSLRKGATVRVLGSTDKYYQIAPPEKAYFFISATFIKAAPATAQYKVPQLKVPAGEAGSNGPTGVTVTVVAPTTLPTVAIITPGPETIGQTGTPISTPGMGTTPGTGTGETTPTTPTVSLPPIAIAPAVVFSETATARFRDANGRYQEECKKPLAQQNLEGLSKEFKDILALENLSPSVKAGAQADITAIDRTMTVQRLLVEQQAANSDTKLQADALRSQIAGMDQAIAAAREAGPYTAQGLLKSSTVVTGKYALVDPDTQRVVAYVDPATAQIDIGSLIGKYIGVRGLSKRMENSDIMVIKVDNATLMPQPK